MWQFISDNSVSLIIVAFGILAWIITIGASVSSRRTGHYVSGIPGVGGILIIIGFLTSSAKWLALAGLLDFHLLYLIFRVIPGILSAERAERKYIPPEEFDGGRVIEYSNFNKEFEVIKCPPDQYGGCEVHYISRYVIISKDDAFVLLKTKINTRIIERVTCRSVKECRMHASDKAKWVSRQANE